MRRKIFVLSFTLYITFISCDDYELQKVFILSKHNIIAPYDPDLGKITPKIWPRWTPGPGHLTRVGAIAEEIMGEYFRDWLQTFQLFSSNCPNDNEIYIYTSTKPRTIATVESFLHKAFPDCSIKIFPPGCIEYDDVKETVLNPVLHIKKNTFKEDIIKEMKLHLNKFNLDRSFKQLQKILEYRHSDKCMEEYSCDLENDLNVASIAAQKIHLNGPLKVANIALDAFLTEFYEGYDIEDIAWGQLTTAEDWDKMFVLKDAYYDVMFNNSVSAPDIAQPLLQKMVEMFLYENKPTFILFMGHDENILTLFKTIGIKPYELEYQQEKTPVGGKVIFQKWKKVASGEIYLRINYVYPSPQQLRELTKLTLNDPPQSQLLEMDNCLTTNQGFCLWTEFTKAMEKAYKKKYTVEEELVRVDNQYEGKHYL